MFFGTAVGSAASNMLIVSVFVPLSCALAGVVGTLKQQMNDMNSLTRLHTMVEVATRPPTLAHNRTRNWKNASLET